MCGIPNKNVFCRADASVSRGHRGKVLARKHGGASGVFSRGGERGHRLECGGGGGGAEALSVSGGTSGARGRCVCQTAALSRRAASAAGFLRWRDRSAAGDE